MSSAYATVVAAGLAAAATISAAGLAALSAYFGSKRDRRRLLYGEAFKAAMGWVEMLYRVRRRTGDDDAALVVQFHDLQETILYHEGWIASDSKYMARSYRRLVRAVKSGTEPLIQAAWDEKPRPAPGNAVPGDVHPNFSVEADAFMKDVRGYLSPIQTRKLWVWGRNNSDGGSNGS